MCVPEKKKTNIGSNFWCREHETRRLGIIRKFSPNTEEIRLGSHTLMAARLVLSANNTFLCSPAAHLPLFQQLLSLFLFCVWALGYWDGGLDIITQDVLLESAIAESQCALASVFECRPAWMLLSFSFRPLPPALLHLSGDWGGGGGGYCEYRNLVRD